MLCCAVQRRVIDILEMLRAEGYPIGMYSSKIGDAKLPILCETAFKGLLLFFKLAIDLFGGIDVAKPALA